MRYPQVILQLPEWIDDFWSEREYSSSEDRMRLVIALSNMNVEYGTGGPFGAGIFDLNTGRLLAPGVNLVVNSNCSIAHAEIIAITTAQQILRDYDLSKKDDLPPYELVTSTEPCAMCFGAIFWSGIKRLICGARSEDAERIGFDEGPKPLEWVKALECRGISVFQDVCREEAITVLQQYSNQGGIIY